MTRELAVAVTDKELEPGGVFAEVHEQVAGLLCGPCPGGAGGHAQDVRAAGLDLHHEEHVQAPKEHREPFSVAGQPVGKPLPANGNSAPYSGVAFSSDSKMLATADSSGSLWLWNAASGKPVGKPIHAATRRDS
jgi:hypothetical protein